MADVGIRALKQNASAVVARATHGEVVTITDRGRPVAHLSPLAPSPLQTMLDAGLARPARRSITDLPAPAPGPALSPGLAAERADGRY